MLIEVFCIRLKRWTKRNKVNECFFAKKKKNQLKKKDKITLEKLVRLYDVFSQYFFLNYTQPSKIDVA